MVIHWFRRRSAKKWAKSATARRPLGFDVLEDRCVLAPLALVGLPSTLSNVPATKAEILPLVSNAALGTTVNYTVTSSATSAVSVSQLTGLTYVDFTIRYTDANNVQQTGDMVFALFPNFAPTTVSTITALVNSGFYNNLLVTRVSPGFVIQTGNPNATASGTPKASSGVSPIDEFNASAIFSGSGQLAMANTGSPDTNDSSFFLTNGAHRALDFKFTLFGQMVRGFDVQAALEKIPLDQQIIGGSLELSKPHNPVVITSAKVIQDNADAVVLITPASPGANANINVSATDGPTTATGAVAVTGVADATNDPPFLPTIPTQSTTLNTPVTFTVNATDLENEALTYTATVQGSTANATTSVNGNQITVTPNTGFTGTIKVLVGVTDPGTSTADTHVVTVQVNPSGSVAPLLATVPTQNTAVNTGVTFTLSTTNNPALNPANVTYSANVPGGATNGTVSVSGTQVTVTPNTGFSGVFTVQVSAQLTGNPNVATENVLVNVNNPPVFGTITNPQVTSINLPVTFHLTSTDTENDAVVYTAVDTDSPSTATVTVNGDLVTVTPNNNFVGTVTLQLGVQDVSGSPTVTTMPLAVTVNATGTPGPTLAAVSNQVTPVNTPITFSLSTASNPSGGAVTFFAYDLDSPSEATVSVTNNQVTVTPNTSFDGTLHVRVGVRQSSGNTNESTQDITVLVNNPPVLAPVSNQTTTQNHPVTFTVSATDTENDAFSFFATILNSPPNAVVSVSGNSITVTPNPNFIGTLNVQVGVQASTGNTQPVAQNIIVTVNNPPTPTPTPTPTPPKFSDDSGLPAVQREVTRMYRELLGRDPDSVGMTAFSNLLNSGFSLFQCMTILERGDEFRTIEIQQLYQTVHGRAADAGGLQSSLNYLRSGGTVQNLRAIMLGSDEYFQANGGTNQSWLTAVYKEVFGRSLDSSGQQTYLALLASGTSRAQVAAILQQNGDALNVRVNELYHRYLGRAADANGIATYVQTVVNLGLPEELFIAGMNASTELQSQPNGLPPSPSQSTNSGTPSVLHVNPDGSISTGNG